MSEPYYSPSPWEFDYIDYDSIPCVRDKNGDILCTEPGKTVGETIALDSRRAVIGNYFPTFDPWRKEQLL